MKVLALDYGSARTGVAISDPSGTVARPLEVVARAGSDEGRRRLVEIVEEEGAELVVVGMPLTLRGEHGAQAEETEAFVESLRSAVRRSRRDLRRALHDEPGALGEHGGGRAPLTRGRARRRAPVDRIPDVDDRPPA